MLKESEELQEDGVDNIQKNVHAVDLDTGENAEVRYELMRGHGELFRVSRKTGEISLKQALEAHHREYKLMIAAYDGGMTPCSTEVSVTVKVVDRSMPVFDKQFYTLSIPENIQLYSPLPVTIKAESMLGRKLIYSIVSGDTLEQFSIDFITGSLYVMDNLDYEVIQQYNLVIRATESFSGVSSEVIVNVLVNDMNDCHPKFPVDSYNVSALESVPVDTLLFRVSSRDNDTGVNGVVHYSIDQHYNNATDYFRVDPDDGSVYLKQPLDHELQNLHHFVIVATDTGIPNLSTSVHIWFHVIDVNDNPPKFQRSSYHCQLSEEATRGQFVTMVLAVDKDLGPLQYTIATGNLHHNFEIDTNTGILSVLSLHRLTENKIHQLNVSVSDGVYTTFCHVQIDIVSSNQHSPVIEHSQYDVVVFENLPSGTSVTKIIAVDEDKDVYGKIMYSIPSEQLLQMFVINNTTGEIFTNQELDREKCSVYEVPVTATDGGGRIGFTLVKITVGDINDNPPRFLLSEYSVCIYSNLTINSPFLKVKARDADEDSSGDIQFSIHDFQPDELFNINVYTGALYLTKPAVDYENQVFQFFVRATDSGTPALYDDVPVQVYIMSSMDFPPLFQRAEQEIFVPEYMDIGSVLTQVKLATNMPVSYRLIGDEGIFIIDSDGQIILTSNLDRETNALHHLGVTALSDSSPPLSSVTEISLHVLDSNDNAPQFDSKMYAVYLAENVQEGTSVIRVHASDPDEGINGEIRYMTESKDNAFSVDLYTGWVTTVSKLDRETIPFYSLILIATDNGSPKQTSSSQLHIRLVDYNDSPPVFTQDSYTASVKEDASIGTSVIKLLLHDDDTEVSASIEYYITAGNPQLQFAISPDGEIFTAKSLDRETQDYYDLTVTITDSKFMITTHVHIHILDVNDEPVNCLREHYHKILPENVSPGSHVLSVLAADNDLEPELRFVLSGDKSQLFHLDDETGELKVITMLDREEMDTYYLTAIVQDRENPEWECVSYIEIVLTDVNDNAPCFSASNYTVTISEDAPIGTLVTKMYATDMDRGINRKIHYHLVNNGENYFEIDSRSGLVRLTKTLDREKQAIYTLTVKALDQGIPQKWNTTLLQVFVLDINDNPPEFVSRSYFVSIPEDTIVGSEIAHVSATSLDAGVNSEIVYTILEGNEYGKFFMDPTTGLIALAQELDYEKSHDYLLTVLATDLGVPPLSNQATVNITVTDSNDNPPIFLQSKYSAQVGEEIRVGDKVLHVSATDVDSGSNGKIEYITQSGDIHQQFSVDPITGLITVARPLDREMISSYNLQIQARDSGTPQQSSSALVKIEVLDTNDNPPLFTQTNYTTIVQESKEPGWPVFHLSVTDADVFPNGAPFVFDILSGDPNNTFRIDQDGTLSTATTLNHLQHKMFMLHVRVYDNGTPPLYSDTWVNIKIIEESQFPPTVTPLDVWVGAYKDRWTGGELGKIVATDKDKYDTLFYGLCSPTPPKLFKIEQHHGILTAAQGLDEGKYVLNVSVTDGKFTSYCNVTVTVQTIWDDTLHHSVSIRLSGITPHHFVLIQKKELLTMLKSALLRDVSVISVQAAPHGDLDVLLAFAGGVELAMLNEILQSMSMNEVEMNCGCENGALCRQQIQLHPDIMYVIATDTLSFVAPRHTNRLYCACNLGFAGDHCEDLLPATECACPVNHVCVPQQQSPGYICLSRFSSPPCAANQTCPPSITSSMYSVTWEELIAICIAVTIILLLVILFIIYSRCRRVTPVARVHAPVLNSGIKRSSKLSNLEVTQHSSRPTSFTSCTNNDVYSSIPLNNLGGTIIRYRSDEDELENVPPDYRRNLNRNTSNPDNKINNDLRRTRESSHRTLSNMDNEPVSTESYVWDCSDWIPASHVPLPNITEVPGSEVSSYNSNDSNDSGTQHNSDPAKGLATLDRKLYLTYNTGDDVMRYGFPVSYSTSSSISTVLCPNENS